MIFFYVTQQAGSADIYRKRLYVAPLEISEQLQI